MEVPNLTRCCCYGEIRAEWPDLKRGRRRGEVTKWWYEECGWLREKKYMKKQKSLGLEMKGTYFVNALNDDYHA